MSANAKSQVRAFWESEACGERCGARQDQARYRFEPEIISFADFPSARGKRVLEVGVGMGADFVRFLRAGQLPPALISPIGLLKSLAGECETKI